MNDLLIDSAGCSDTPGLLDWQKALRNTQFILSAKSAAQFPKDSLLDIVFAGRSNAGKSSTLNALTDHRGLARFSKTPGRTDSINFFSVVDLIGLYLVDVPGYGYNQRGKSITSDWHALMESYFQLRSDQIFLVLIMDARHPLQPFDLDMLGWAQTRDIKTHILLNKSDKLSKSQATLVYKKVHQTLSESFSNFSLQSFSALKKEGTDILHEKLRHTWHLSKAAEAHSPSKDPTNE